MMNRAERCAFRCGFDLLHKEKIMKKLVLVLVSAVSVAASASAFGMSVGVKGILGADNSSVSGVAFGGGLDINLDLAKGFGVQIEGNIAPCKTTSSGDGLTVADSMMIQIPVMAWYNLRLARFGLGLGLGASCTISDKHQEDAFGTKMGLAAGARMRFFVTDSFALSVGVTGNLDCLPTLTRTTDGDSSTYRLVKSDFSRNAVYGSLGVEYKIPLSK